VAKKRKYNMHFALFLTVYDYPSSIATVKNGGVA
jgi:hypothetical protein